MNGKEAGLDAYIPYIVVILRSLAAAAAGIFLGNGAVYFFNHMPPVWFTEYGEEPSEELRDPYTQRVKSWPWKFLFSMLFVGVGIWMVNRNWRAAAVTLAAGWLLVEMGIADLKYRIVPDQLVILLAASSVGMLPYHDGWKDFLLGALAGGGLTFLTGLAGKILTGRFGAGGGDIKAFTAMGLVTGLYGIVFVYILSALFACLHFGGLLLRKKVKRTDSLPLMPYAAAAFLIYIVFFWGRLEIWLRI